MPAGLEISSTRDPRVTAARIFRRESGATLPRKSQLPPATIFCGQGPRAAVTRIGGAGQAVRRSQLGAIRPETPSDPLLPECVGDVAGDEDAAQLIVTQASSPRLPESDNASGPRGSKSGDRTAATVTLPSCDSHAAAAFTSRVTSARPCSANEPSPWRSKAGCACAPVVHEQTPPSG